MRRRWREEMDYPVCKACNEIVPIVMENGLCEYCDDLMKHAETFSFEEEDFKIEGSE